MGRISITDLELYGKHGYYKEEKQLSQLFKLDISFSLDIEKAADSDELSETVNYEEIVGLCEKVFEEPTSLIETLAVRTAQSIRTAYPFISDIKVKLSKPQVQLGKRLKEVSVSYQLD